jgi:hypothetical protein
MTRELLSLCRWISQSIIPCTEIAALFGFTCACVNFSRTSNGSVHFDRSRQQSFDNMVHAKRVSCWTNHVPGESNMNSKENDGNSMK